VSAALGQPLALTRDDIAAAWQATRDIVQPLGEGLLVFLLFVLAARLLRNLVSRVLAGRSLRSDAALLATRSVYIGVLSLGAVMFAAVALGNALVGAAGILVAAAVTSLGLQDLVKNYVSGFYVLMEKNVRVGDLVETGGYRGVVTEMRMRVTYLRGASGEMIVVPNGELFGRTLVVSQAPPGWGSGAKGVEHDPDQGIEVTTW
jgi:small-conductance mechanosensitive channel